MTKVVMKPLKPQGKREGSVLTKGLKKAVGRSLRRPRFSGSWIFSGIPIGSKEIESYQVMSANVKIFSLSDGRQYLYHLVPWEHTLDDNSIGSVNRAIEHVSNIPPTDLTSSPDALRSHIHSVASSFLRQTLRGGPILERGRVRENEEIVENMASVVVRHTIGMGVFEILLAVHHADC